MGEFRYGDHRTIHATTEVDVELDTKGQVVAVWFRCHPLPFRQSLAHADRAASMRRMYAQMKDTTIKAIVFDEPGILGSLDNTASADDA